MTLTNIKKNEEKRLLIIWNNETEKMFGKRCTFIVWKHYGIQTYRQGPEWKDALPLSIKKYTKEKEIEASVRQTRGLKKHKKGIKTTRNTWKREKNVIRESVGLVDSLLIKLDNNINLQHHRHQWKGLLLLELNERSI